jgi:hypothetical protein
VIERVGFARHILGTGEIEKADEGSEVIAAQTLVDVFVQPCKKKGVEGLCKVVPVIWCAVGIEEDSTKLLLDELGLVRKSRFKSMGLNAQEISYNIKNIDVSHNSGILISVAVNHKFEIAQVENGSD